MKDSWALISCVGLIWRSCSGEGDREGSDSGSVIEQSFRSLFLKVGGLECVLFLFGGWGGVDVKGRVGCNTGREGDAAG